MKTKLFFPIFKSFLVFGFLLVFSSSQAQIASWTYDSLLGTNANPTPNTGSGSSSIVTGAVQSADSAFQGRTPGLGCGAPDSGFSWSFTNFNPGVTNESNGVQYNASTVGYIKVIFTWEMRFSNTAPNTVRLQYTTDGSTWINADLNTIAVLPLCGGSITTNGCFQMDNTNSYRHISADFTSIPAVENNANFGVRILAAYDPNFGTAPGYQGFQQTGAPGTVATNQGTWRFDNVSISGTPIAPPTSVTMTAGPPTTVCAGASTNLYVTFTGGVGPFTLTYTDTVSGSNTIVTNYVSGTAIPITPASTRTYSIVSLAHAGGVLNSGFTGTPAITVTVLPTIATAATATTVCFSASSQTTPLTYTATTGFPAPNRYSIVWNASPANSFATVTNAVLPASPITITIPAGTPAGTYTGNITVKNSAASACSSISKTFTITINPTTVITTQPSTSPQTTCSDSVFSPISVAASGTGLTYQWFINYLNSTTGGTALTGASYTAEVANGSKTATFTPLTTTTIPLHIQSSYYYYVQVSGSCSAVKSTVSGVFTVENPPVGGTATGDQTLSCGSSPSAISVSGYSPNVLSSIARWELAYEPTFASPTTIAGSANLDTLTPALLGIVGVTTYYRAVIVGCRAVYSTTVTITVGASTTWDGTSWSASAPIGTSSALITGNLTITSDMSMCSLNITSGTVTVNPGVTLTVENAVVVSGTGSLYFKDSASLIQSSTATANTNSGPITYEKNVSIRKFDYTYWSSPVVNQTLALFSPYTLADKYWYWNATLNNWYTINNNNTMSPAQGYIIRGPQTYNDGITPFPTAALTSWTGNFIGVPNNGDYSVSIIKTASNDMNFIGNPYPSAVDADLFVANNAAAFPSGTTLYFWTHNMPITNNNYAGNDFATYNSTGGTGSGLPSGSSAICAPCANTLAPTGKIATGQGFMIKATFAGTGTIAATFKNSMRVTGNNGLFYRTNQAAGKNRVWLDLTNADGGFKQMLVGYIQDATNEVENSFDGELLEAENPVSLYSINTSKKLTIQGRALPFDSNDQVPVGYKIPTTGSYTITLSKFDGLFTDATVNVLLEDKLLNTIHDLRQSPYTFVSEAGTFDTRFVLRYTNTALAVNPLDFKSNGVVVFKQNDAIHIATSNSIMKSIKVFDISGRLLLEKKEINSTETSFVSGFSHEVLLVEITSENNETITKKVVN